MIFIPNKAGHKRATGSLHFVLLACAGSVMNYSLMGSKKSDSGDKAGRCSVKVMQRSFNENCSILDGESMGPPKWGNAIVTITEQPNSVKVLLREKR